MRPDPSSRTPALRLGALLLLAGLLPLVAGCGESPQGGRQARSTDRTVAGGSVLRAKRPSPVGEVTLGVVDRPAPDRAVLEAVWERRLPGGACAVELVLPEGAWLVEGVEVIPVASEALRGSVVWQVGFPLGRALDAVVRLCVRTEQGEGAAEATVRLVQDPAPVAGDGPR